MNGVNQTLRGDEIFIIMTIMAHAKSGANRDNKTPTLTSEK
jgi:hypothetical protein